MNRNPVLLVEDNPDDEALAIRAFERNGIANEVLVVRDGAQALDYLFGRGAFAGRDLSSMPHVVLLDLNLPKLNGLEVLRCLRAHPATACLPVVILSSSAEEQDRITAYRLGCNGYVRKPVDFVRFTEAVQGLAFYWLLLNESPPVRVTQCPVPMQR